ncbi:cytochrome P450 [Streptomyces sp. 8N706]|uniref:cytochrome P450 n=1 Tax=Streptomyces sp. 8N706 TaxID=3457416 RepID=UPI003FD2CF7D
MNSEAHGITAANTDELGTAGLRLADTFVVANPYPYYEALRARGRVHWNDELFGGAWLFLGFDDVKELLRDSDSMSNARYRAIVDQLEDEEAKGVQRLLELHSRWMIFFDPPKHTRLRKIMARGFSRGVLESMRRSLTVGIQAHVDELRQQRQLDFIGGFAQRIPLLAIASLLGVDSSDQADFIRWTHDIAVYMGSEVPDAELIANAQNSMVEFQSYFDAIVRDRQRRPLEDDLLSLLVVAGPDEELLSPEDLFAQSTLLLFAAFETTKNLISSGILSLLRNPRTARMVADVPDRVPDVVSEVLRCESPVQFARRIVARDFEFGGHQLRKGEVAAMLIGAANRDPLMFDAPDEFRIDRSPQAYLSFGAGRHLCLGQHLARMEAELALGRLFGQLPGLLGEPGLTYSWNINPGFRGLAELSVSL